MYQQESIEEPNMDPASAANNAADVATIDDLKENANGVTKEDIPNNKASSAAGSNSLAVPPMENGGAPTAQQMPYIYPLPILPAYNYNYTRTPSAGNKLTGQIPLNPCGYTDLAYCQDPAKDTRRNRGGVTQAFPDKLHEMLEGVERDGQTDIVSFFSHGRAFAIHKPRKFVSDILPKYFKQGKLTSFQRQLNLYGFKRLSQGPDSGGYYHELFLKGRPGLSVNMKRTKIRGTPKQKRDPASEPNFYTYPPIGGAPPVAMAMPQQSIIPTSDAPGAMACSGLSPTHPTSQPPQVGDTSPTPYQALPYFPPFNLQLPMIAPYTAAQQPNGPVFPIPPDLPSYTAQLPSASGTTTSAGNSGLHTIEPATEEASAAIGSNAIPSAKVTRIEEC